METEKLQGVKSAVKRQEFIEFRLYWEGRINRGDLIDFFRVTAPVASADIKKYLEKAPGNLEYDPSAKRYFSAKEFNPVLIEPKAEHYLASLKALADGRIGRSEIYHGNLPEYNVLPMPRRVIDPSVLRELLQAIREKKSIEIEYLSMREQEKHSRTICPHALGCDGERWHIRAFCKKSNDYRDFVIDRIQSTKLKATIEKNLPEDKDWNEEVNVILAPHPKLSKSMKKAVATGYGMMDNLLQIKIKKAMLYYMDRRMNLLKTDEKTEGAQIILLNKQEVGSIVNKK